MKRVKDNWLERQEQQTRFDEFQKKFLAVTDRKKAFQAVGELVELFLKQSPAVRGKYRDQEQTAGIRKMHFLFSKWDKNRQK